MIIYNKDKSDDLVFTSRETCYNCSDDFECNNITCVIGQWRLGSRCSEAIYNPNSIITDYNCPTLYWHNYDDSGEDLFNFKYSWLGGTSLYCCKRSGGGSTCTILTDKHMSFNAIYNPGDSDFCLKVMFDSNNSYSLYETCARCYAGRYVAVQSRLYGNCNNIRIFCACCYSYCRGDGLGVTTCTVTCTMTPITLYFIKSGVNCYICTDSQLISDDGIFCSVGSFCSSECCYCRTGCVSTHLYPSNIKVLSGNVKYPKPIGYKTE